MVKEHSDLAQIQNLTRAHPFLAGLSAHHIELLASCATLKHFGEGELIFRIGEPANGFFLITAGVVSIEGSVSEHGTITTETLFAGEPLGWSWLFPPYTWHYHARAIKPTTAVFFDAPTLHQLCNEDLILGHELFKRMSEVMVRRLQASRAKLVEALK
jgi:CRP/FNR family transcriptional regulator, cyclic AMP receptor protein